MATNSSNDITYSETSNVDAIPVPACHCIPWLVVFGILSLAIVSLNLITIIIFVKLPRLQRRSIYFIIHLATVDLLVGLVVGPLLILNNGNGFCQLWKLRSNPNWLLKLRIIASHAFYQVSLLNLAVIALERLHAAARPLKHRFIKKRVYGVIIALTWLLPLAMNVLEIELVTFSDNSVPPFLIRCLYTLILLSLMCVCYISIYIKVRCSRHPQHHGAVGLRERKLTSTLFLVTLGSLLTYLPKVVFWGVFNFPELSNSLPKQITFNIYMAVLTIVTFNSLINPIIYAIRMPEFRAAINQMIFRKSTNRLSPVDFPL